MRGPTVLGIALTMTLVAACGGSGDRVIVGAGTTLVDSGFIDALVAVYESETANNVSVVAESSQRLFDLGRRGEVDILVTHHPEELSLFADQGFARDNAPVFASEFLLLGPAERAGALTGLDPASAFAAIAGQQLRFVSRADGSGTYRQEMLFWAEAGIEPAEQAWYETTGQGMGLTLQVAAQRRAFVLAEEGSWLVARDALDLVPLELDGEPLPNTYWATVVAGDTEGAAGELFEWLVSDAGERAIERTNAALFGESVYGTYERSLP